MWPYCYVCVENSWQLQCWEVKFNWVAVFYLCYKTHSFWTNVNFSSDYLDMFLTNLNASLWMFSLQKCPIQSKIVQNKSRLQIKRKMRKFHKRSFLQKPFFMVQTPDFSFFFNHCRFFFKSFWLAFLCQICNVVWPRNVWKKRTSSADIILNWENL